MRARPALILLLIIFPIFLMKGQLTILPGIFKASFDTNYITSYVTDFTTRVYSSVKYNMMGYDDSRIDQRLAYRPNNKLMLGIGVNHGILGINIGFNLPFVNADDKKYGTTEYYDFTLRMFAPKFNLTFYLQTYNGFYLRNTSTLIPGWQKGDPYYIRDDLRNSAVGMDMTYILNSRRFSYRAAVVQTEWQKKSAGSLIIGGGFLYNVTNGSSSIVPDSLNYPSFYDSLRFDRSYNFSIGPLIGYAYTLVIKKHFFFTGSLNGSLNLGFTKLRLLDNADKMKSGPILGFRTEVLISAGYNSSRWYFGVSYVNMNLENQAPIQKCSISYDTGVFRINLVRRFATKKPLKLLNPGYK